MIPTIETGKYLNTVIVMIPVIADYMIRKKKNIFSLLPSEMNGFHKSAFILLYVLVNVMNSEMRVLAKFKFTTGIVGLAMKMILVV